jgi:hypothetical protein
MFAFRAIAGFIHTWIAGHLARLRIHTTRLAPRRPHLRRITALLRHPHTIPRHLARAGAIFKDTHICSPVKLQLRPCTKIA